MESVLRTSVELLDVPAQLDDSQLGGSGRILELGHRRGDAVEIQAHLAAIKPLAYDGETPSFDFLGSEIHGAFRKAGTMPSG
jgi:hypothetical protein